MRRWLLAGGLGVLVLAYPLLVSGFPVYERLRETMETVSFSDPRMPLAAVYSGQILDRARGNEPADRRTVCLQCSRLSPDLDRLTELPHLQLRVDAGAVARLEDQLRG